MKFGKAVVKCRVLILIIAFALMVPSLLGMIFTRVNYDMLNYLPDNLETVKGQEYLMKDFGKGAFSFLIIEDMDKKDVVKLEDKIKKIDHVDTVLWYSDVADLSVPMEVLPDKIKDAFNTDNATLMAIFFDSGTSSDETMDAITEIRATAGEQCFLSGMSAMVTDMRDLAEKQETIYVAIAVVLAVVVMMLFMDSWIIPFVFLLSIGMSILLNMGTNYFFGEISYITKALAAVLQLAVTMDYSIFLWHSYESELSQGKPRDEAMAALYEAHALIEAHFPEEPTSEKTGVISSETIFSSQLHRFDATYHLAAGKQYDSYIKSHFAWHSLGDVSQSISRPGIAKRMYVKDGITFMGGTDLFLSVPDSDKKLSRKAPNLDEYLIQEGWILLPRSGTIGDVVFTNEQHAQKLVSEHVVRIIPNNILRRGFVFSFLSSNM